MDFSQGKGSQIVIVNLVAAKGSLGEEGDERERDDQQGDEDLG